jgi:hypothetical protein
MPHGIAINEIKSRIDNALNELTSQSNDKYLLEHNLGERCIAHRFAVHLEAQFPDWDVDCEYNRNGDELKEMPLSEECKALLRKTDRVVPDIIIHKRGAEGPNLLAIEVKREGQPGEECDNAKLEGYISMIGYSCGLFVSFKSGKVDEHIAKKIFLQE